MDRKILREKTFLEHVMLYYNVFKLEDIQAIGDDHYKLMEKLSLLPPEEAPNVPSIQCIALTLKALAMPYKVNEQLLTALDQKANIKLETKLLIKKLKLNQLLLLELPYSHRCLSEYNYHKSCIVGLTDKFNVIRYPTKYSLIFVWPTYCNDKDTIDEDEHNVIGHSYTLLPLEEKFTCISDLMRYMNSIETHPAFDPITEDRIHLVEKIIKTLLYIHSGGNPDMREVKGNPIKTKKPKKAMRQIQNSSIFPYISVGMGYEKSPLYVKSQWEYLRWQPYGPRKNPDYKLIKITAQRRKPMADEILEGDE